MVQFYFLAVLLNILCGLILVYENDETELPGIDKIREGISGESLFKNQMFRLVSGALCLITGLVIFFAPYKGIPVFGDLLPALSCILSGAATLLGYFEERNDEFVAPEILDTILITNKMYIGIAALLFGVIHFILPGVPLL